MGSFHDGVVFPDEYRAAAVKVLWVLKNSYDETDEEVGDSLIRKST